MKYLPLFMFLLICCSSKEKKEEEFVLVRVENEVLTNNKIKTLKEGVYKNTSNKVIAQKWAEKELLYNAARKNGFLNDKKLIEKRDAYYKNLIISSYLESEKNKNIKISKKDINNYYLKNKNSFKRKDEEVLINHFIVDNKKEAYNIKNVLKKKKKGEEKEALIKKHKPTLKKLKYQLMKDSFFSFVFNKKNNQILGPKKDKSFYHVVEVVKVYEKNTIMGLEIVYDEIYNRLYKKQELLKEKLVIDSLYKKADVFLEPSLK